MPSCPVTIQNNGDTWVWTTRVCNSGPNNATGVYVQHVMPAGASVTSDAATHGSYDSITGVWTIGDLSVGECAMLTMNMSVTDISLAPFVKSATVFGNEFDPIVLDDSDEDTVVDFCANAVSCIDLQGGNNITVTGSGTLSDPWIVNTTSTGDVITTLVDNGDGTYTYTSEDGTVTVISDTSTSTLVDNGDGTLTYTDEAGTVTTFNTGWTTAAVDNLTNDLTFTYPDGTIVNFSEIVTTIVDNNNGSFTYTNEDGTSVTWTETLTTLTDNGNGTITYVDEAGASTIIPIISTLVSVDGNNDITFTYSDGTTLVWAEIVSTLVDNLDGTFTYTDETGLATNIALSAGITVTVNADNSVTYTYANGSTVSYDESLTSLAYTPGTNTLTYTDEDGNANLLSLNVVSIALDPNNRSFNFVDELGNTTNIDICNMVDNCETVTSVAYNGATGDLTYTDEDGVANVVNIPTENFLGTAAYNNTTNELTLTLSNGTTFTVDLADLVDTVQLQVTDTNTVDLTLAGTGSTASPWVISADTTISPVAGNILIDDGNGLYVPTDVETTTTLVDNGDGTYTYTNEVGATTSFDSGWTTGTIGPGNQLTLVYPDGSNTTFSETTTTLALAGDNQSLQYVDEDGVTTTLNICNIVDNCETVTTLTYNAGTNQLTFTDEGNVSTTITLNSETVTTIVDNNNGSFTYTNESGASVTWNETTSTITDNGNGSFTYTNEDGVSTTWNETTTTLVDNGNGSLSYTNEDGVIVTWNETTTSIAINGTTTGITYTDEDGTGNNVDLCTVVANCETTTSISIAGSNLTYTDEDGIATVIALPTDTLTTLVANGTNTGLVYTDELGIANTIDLCPVVAGCETTTSISYNAVTNTITYVDEDGVSTALAISGDTTTTLVDNANGSFTYTNEVGATTTWNETTTSISIAGNNLTYNDEDGVANVVALPANTLTSLTVNAAQTGVNYIDELGNTNSIDLCPVVSNCETVTSISFATASNTLSYINEDGVTTNLVLNADATTTLTDNGNGTYTYVNEVGAVTTFNSGWTTAVVDGNNDLTITYPDGSTLVYAENITTLVNNANGTYTYTNESGATSNIDINAGLSVTVNADNSVTYTYANGTTISYDETLTSLAYDGGTNSLNYTDESGAISNLPLNVSSIALNANNTSIDYVNQLGVTTNIDLCNIVNNCETLTSISYNGATGDLTFNDEDGNANVVNIPAENFLGTATYNNATNILTLTLTNGTTFDVDMSDLVDTVALQVTDSTSIDFTLSGDGSTATPWDITAVASVSTTAGNILTIDGTGLYVPTGTETTTTLIDNANGTYTYTNEVGTTTTFNTGWTAGTIDANNDLTLTYPDGTTTVFSEQVTSIALGADNQSIDYTDEAGIITNLNLCTITQNCETTTSIVYDTITGSLTYTNEDGLATAIVLNDSKSVVTQSVVAGNQVASHTDGDGVTVAILETITSLTYTAATNSLTYTDEAGAANAVPLSYATVTVADTTCVNMTLSGSGAAADPYVIQADPIIDGVTAGNDIICGANGLYVPHETTTTITNQIVGNTIATYTNEDSVAYDINESVTTIADLGTGIIRYTAENGVFTDIDICTVIGNCSIGSLSDVDTTGIGAGSTLYFDGTNWINLGIGTAGQILTVNLTATSPEWSNPAGDFDVTVLDTTCIDMTRTGTGTVADPYVISAVPIIDAVTVRNELVCGINGMYSPNAKQYDQDNTAATIPAVLVDPTGVVNPIVGDSVVQRYSNGVVLSTYDGAAWINKDVPAGGDGETSYQDNTAIIIPTVLTDPTVIAVPVQGDAVVQDYSDGVVLSTFDGAVWTNTAIRDCVDSQVLCDPNNADATVIVIVAGDGTMTYFNNDGTAFAGDTTALTQCCCVPQAANLTFTDANAASLVVSNVTDDTVPFNAGITISGGFINAAAAYHQNNTGNDIPVVLVDPTLPAAPNTGDMTLQQYDNGSVLSIYDGTAWVNVPLQAPQVILPFDDDVAAAAGGVAVGELYKLSATNLYALPSGIYKEREA